jgi:hypothetical protein
VLQAFILVGILAMLGIITLTQQVAGANEGTVAYTLAEIKDWTFLLGPGLGRQMGQRTDPRLSDVPLGTCAETGLLARPHRRAAHHHHRNGRAVQRQRSERLAALAAGHPDAPRVPLGTLPRHLLHVQSG